MATQITQGEVLEAIAKAYGENPDGVTAEELRDSLGLSEDRLRKGLRQLAKEGRLQVSRRYFMDLSGRRNWTPTYIILPKRKKNA